MTATTSAGPSVPTGRTSEVAAGAGVGRRGLRRLLGRTADQQRSSRRAGVDPLPAVLVTPRVWVALG